MNPNNNQNNNYKNNQNRVDKFNNKPEYNKFDNKNSDYKIIESKNIHNKKLSENQPSENKLKVLKSFISVQNTTKNVDQSNLNVKKPSNDYNSVIKENKNIVKEKKPDNFEPKTNTNNKNLKKSENKTSDKPTYVSKQAFIGDRKKPKKVYADDYEQERDFKLNIYKKNIYATPYFQEKKRRNTFIGKKPKPKEEESWKKKHKKYSNKQND